MATLRVNQIFTSWEDFFKAVDQYSCETSQPFVKSSMKTCIQANKFVKPGFKIYPLEMKYTYYKFTCSHAGTFKLSGKGDRKTRSQKQSCGAKIYAALDTKDRTKIIVKQLVDEHNHETGPQLFERYVKQRKLNPSEKSKAEELVRLNVPTRDLRNEMVRVSGKPVTLQDVHNIRKSVHKKLKTSSNSNNDNNDDQQLVHKLKEFQQGDQDMVVNYRLDNNTLQYVYMQTSQMRQTFSDFPEHVCIDCTYGVNDRDMPLISFLVVDGNLRSRLIAFAFISNESSSMLTHIFTMFKTHNPSCSSIKTFMVDKDMNEIARLRELFPHAFCELCLFHVKKAFKEKIDSLACTADCKLQIKSLIKRMCYSTSIAQYTRLKEELLPLHQPFSQYFMENWDSIHQSWVLFARSEHVNFGDTTNNRIESYHQKLKSVITSPTPLDVCVSKVLLLNKTILDECIHLNFMELTKKSPSLYPELQKHITPHALRIAAREVERSVQLLVHLCESMFYVQAEGDTNCHEVTGDRSSCSCEVSVSLLLPCRHIVAVRVSQGESPLSIALFHQRWLLSYNIVSVPLPVPVSESYTNVSSCDWRTPSMDKGRQYGLAEPQVKRLLHMLVGCGDERLQYYLDRLNEFTQKVSESKNFYIVGGEEVEDVVSSQVDVVVGSQVEDVAAADAIMVTV